MVLAVSKIPRRPAVTSMAFNDKNADEKGEECRKNNAFSLLTPPPLSNTIAIAHTKGGVLLWATAFFLRY